jgi:beta-galactosidase/beta-glucuronidase
VCRLHDATFEVIVNGVQSDTLTTRIGLREVRGSNLPSSNRRTRQVTSVLLSNGTDARRVFVVNGKRILVRGGG